MFWVVAPIALLYHKLAVQQTLFGHCMFVKLTRTVICNSLRRPGILSTSDMAFRSSPHRFNLGEVASQQPIRRHPNATIWPSHMSET